MKGSVNTRGDPLGPQRRVGSLLVLNPLFVEKGEGGAQTQLSDSCRARTSCHGDVDFSLAHAWDTQPPAQTVSVCPGHWGTRAIPFIPPFFPQPFAGASLCQALGVGLGGRRGDVDRQLGTEGRGPSWCRHWAVVCLRDWIVSTSRPRAACPTSWALPGAGTQDPRWTVRTGRGVSGDPSWSPLDVRVS